MGLNIFGFVNKTNFDRAGLESDCKPSSYSPKKLVNFFGNRYKDEYKSPSYVWEEEKDGGCYRHLYSIKCHTIRVIEQFEKFNSFNGKLLSDDLIDKNLFRVILTLHDIGVHSAVQEGKQFGENTVTAKKRQHPHTTRYIKSILTELLFNDSDISFARALVSGDPIGNYLKNGGRTAASMQISRMADTAQLPIQDFFNVLTVFYMCDASSYTENGGGIRSLDHLFIFDRKNRALRFAYTEKGKMDDLEHNFIRKISYGAIPIMDYDWYDLIAKPSWISDLLPGEVTDPWYFTYRLNSDTGKYQVKLGIKSKPPKLWDPGHDR